MQVTQEQLRHVVFLSEVVLEGNKRGMMEETIQLLLYIVKSLKEAEIPTDVSLEMEHLTAQIEERLKQENDRLQEIELNLHFVRKPTKP
ncbi:hypothetical protein [Paenibacillus gansuensis]|uniref:Uncharacterized protein n=1 Tax=Paenibacillus gansuensis TaxID=306542 RepID=A0ABW5PDZ9_9BACL